MEIAKAALLSLALLAPVRAACSETAVELSFASGGTRADGTIQGSYLDVAAELPLSPDLRFGLAANSNSYDRDGYVYDTAVWSLAPNWRVHSGLHVGGYYERFQWHLGGVATEFRSLGAEALYAVTDGVSLGGYLGTYRGADWGTEASTNLGFSARTAVGESFSLFAFMQRDLFDGGWWQDTGLGGARALGGSGLGLTIRYSERRYSDDATVLRSLFIGGSIAVGRLEGSAPEFRARHCVMCELPI